MPQKNGQPTRAEKAAADAAAASALLKSADDASVPPIPDKRSGVKTRVAYVVALMSAGKYNGYVSRQPMAKTWGVSDSVVRNYTAEAHRLLTTDDPGELEHRRNSLSAFLAKRREEAAVVVDSRSGIPDYKAVATLTELEAKLLGIPLAPVKVEHTGKDGGPIALTLDDVDAALDAADKNAGAGS
jgi:hypothetical protein